MEDDRFKESGIERTTGACKFCGQLKVLAPIKKNLTQDELDNMATMACDCEGGRLMQRIEANKVRAEDNINRLCKEERHKRIGITLKKALDDMANGFMRSIVIDDGEKTKFKVRITDDYSFKVEKTVTHKESLE